MSRSTNVILIIPLLSSVPVSSPAKEEKFTIPDLNKFTCINLLINFHKIPNRFNPYSHYLIYFHIQKHQLSPELMKPL